MQLQLALDFITAEKGMEVALAVKDLVDVVELGTPFVFTNPISVVREFKKALPGVKILADYKILDGGGPIAKIAFDAGADITTVSARTWDGTIREALDSAKAAGGMLMADMMGTPDSEIVKRGLEVDQIGVDYICVHRAISIKGASSPEATLALMRNAAIRAKLAVAGGIDLETLKKVAQYKPDLVIVGSSIISAKDPRAMTLAMREVMAGK